MKRALKIGLVAVGSLVALVVAVVALVCWLVLTPARLTGIVNGVADRYLDCELAVGEVDLTVIQTFPNVSLKLSDVALVNPVEGATSDTVASIPHGLAVLDMEALVKERKVVLRSLQLQGGWANLYVNAAGVANYMVLPMDTLSEEEPDDTTTFAFSEIDIKQIDLRDLRVDYCDVAAGHQATVEGLTMQLQGHLMDESLQAALNLTLKGVEVALEDNDAMRGQLTEVTIDVKGTMQGDDAMADLLLKAGRVDALMPDMEAHVEQLVWHLNGEGRDGVWSGTTALTTQPLSASLRGTTVMDAALTHMQFKAEGKWQGKDLVLTPALTLPSLTLDLDGERMLDKAAMQLRATMNTDTLMTQVALSDALLALNEHEITLAGGVEMPDTATLNADIRFETNHIDIDRLLVLVPQSYQSLLEGIEVDGGVVLKGKACGSMSGGEAQIGNVEATLALDNIDLLYNDSIALQTDVTRVDVAYDGKRDYAKGSLSAGALQLAMTGMADARLRDVEGDFTIAQAMRMAEGYVDAQVCLSMEELAAAMDTMGLYAQKPSMDIRLDADKENKLHFDAELHLDTMNAAVGTMMAASTQRLRIKAHADYDETGDNILAQWDPHLAVDVHTGDVETPLLTLPLEIPHLKFDYADGHFTINDSRILLGNSDFGLRGDVHSIDSFINKTGLLKADLDFSSSYTDVTQLMDLVSGFGSTEEPEEEAEETEVDDATEDDPFMVPLGVDVKLNTDIRTVNVNGFDFDDIGGHLLVKDGVLVLEEMGFTSDAARMQLTAMYKSPRKNHLFVGFDFHLLDIEIDELIRMIPDVDSIVPMLKAFDGEAEFHFAGETYLKSNYDIKMSTLRAAAAIEGKDLVVMDNETFAQISKYLLFDKDTKNVVDSLSVELTVFKDEVDLYPFLISLDDYKAVIGGRHNINENFDFNYHVSLTAPLRLGLDIGGTLDDMKFKLVGCKYAQMYNPKKQNAVQARTLQLKKIISDSLKDNVKLQPKRQ